MNVRNQNQGGCRRFVTLAWLARRGVTLCLLIGLLATGLGLLNLPPAGAQPQATPQTGPIKLLEIDGVINPMTARYLQRSLRDAEAQGARLVILRLNTPGGLESSMREMAQALLGARVPTVVYVSPPGGRAASAGMFITIAAHVAVMAPGTNIGSAHPVGLGGPDQGEVMEAKVTHDAAAFARALAEERGRNAAWAEQAVRESVNISASEAAAQDVIDFVATDMDDLLRQLHGREVTTVAGTFTLDTRDAPISERPMNFAERVLLALSNPNIAYLLLTIGTVGIIAELYNPGNFFPGITGVLSLILAFTALGSLPVNWAGVFLIVLAIGLFIAELNTEGIGFLAVGAVAAFILGSLMLFTPVTPPSPALPAVRIHPAVIGSVTALIALFFLVTVRAVVDARRLPVSTGLEQLRGKMGVALSDLTPGGQVRVESEVWSAVGESNQIRAGEPVEVVDVDGVTLRVRRS